MLLVVMLSCCLLVGCHHESAPPTPSQQDHSADAYNFLHKALIDTNLIHKCIEKVKTYYSCVDYYVDQSEIKHDINTAKYICTNGDQSEYHGTIDYHVNVCKHNKLYAIGLSNGYMDFWGTILKHN